MKTVIIVGAANGIGREIAEILKEEKLILIDIDKPNLEKVSLNLGCDHYFCDVSNEKEVDLLVKEIKNKISKVDCLINCAGMWISGDISKMKEKMYLEMNELTRIKKAINVNIFGTIAMIKEIFPIMKEQGYGQIININSQSGVMCEPMFPVYNATKIATNSFRKAIQNDLAKNNIKITDICPGLVDTGFYDRANNSLPQSIMSQSLNVKDIANTVKYIYDLPHEITIPSIEIRNIKNY